MENIASPEQYRAAVDQVALDQIVNPLSGDDLAYEREIAGAAELILKARQAELEFGAQVDRKHGPDKADHPNIGNQLDRAAHERIEEIADQFPNYAASVGRDVYRAAERLRKERAGLPYGFERVEGAGSVTIDSFDKFETKRLCSEIKIEAATYDLDDQRNGMCVSLYDTHKGWTEVQYDKSEVGVPGWTKRFTDAGLTYDVKRVSDLHNLFLNASSDRVWASTSRVGWETVTINGEERRVYVTPSKVYGVEDADDYRVILRDGDRFKIGQDGSLAAWQDTVAKPCEPHSRYVMAIAFALGTTMLTPLEMESGGFNFVTVSSRGKTTLLQCVGSVFGSGDEKNGYIEQATLTANGGEVLASKYNDQCLPLDEIGQLKNAGSFVYTIANGQGKQRMSKTLGDAGDVHGD